MNTSASVKSAVRVLDLFELLSRWGAHKTHAEIAEELGIPKSSLTQLLKTLTARGYLVHSPLTRGYQLGPALAELAGRSSRYRGLLGAADNVLAELTRQTGETSALNLLKGDVTEVVAVATSPSRLHYLMARGDEAPLYATSSGLAILAHLPKPMIEDYLGRVAFERFAANTPTSSKEVANAIRRVHRLGFAYVNETFTPGVVGLAVPILDRGGYPLAAINVALPLPRFTESTRRLIIDALSAARGRLAFEDTPSLLPS